MLEFFTLKTILVGAITAYAIGMVWYSPALFMNSWLYGLGMRHSDIPKRDTRYFMLTMIYTFVVSLLISSTLALMLDVANVGTLKEALRIAIVICFGFIVTVKFTDMLYTMKGKFYGKEAQILFLVSSGYYIVTFILMTISMYYIGCARI